MCGIFPLMAAGKVSPGTVAAGIGGLSGLALRAMNKKKKDPPTASQTFYGSNAGGA
jgi:hypothetical protein